MKRVTGLRLLGCIAGATAITSSVLLAPSPALAVTPNGMLAPGTYPLTMSFEPPSQTQTPSLSVTDNGIYLQSFTLPPDNIQLALSPGTTPGSVDLDSIYIDGTTYSSLPCSGVCLDQYYRPPSIDEITSPYEWGGSYYQNPNDPTNPQWDEISVSFVAYPPLANQEPDGSQTLEQEIDATLTFGSFRVTSGTINQINWQVVGDPGRFMDSFNGNISSSAGSEHISEIVTMGNIGDPVGA